MAYLDNLIAAQNNIAALIAQVTAERKPSYSIDGESISWESYLAMLLDKQETLDKTIQRAQAPFSLVTRGRA